LVQHNEARRLRDVVNAAVVHGKLTFLSGEIVAPCGRDSMRDIQEGSANRARRTSSSSSTLRVRKRAGDTKQTAVHDDLSIPCSSLEGHLIEKRSLRNRRLLK